MNDPAIILIVDDIAANRNFLTDILSASGYVVVTASGGHEALRKIGSAPLDLVLLDVLMPDMSGYEVCKLVRSNPARGLLPIIMVTALDATPERVKGLEAGADDFITKPINQAELLARVRSLLRIKSLYDTVRTQAAELAALNEGLEERVTNQVRQLQRLEQLKRFFPPQLARLIAEGDVDDPLRTRRREVTVVVLDLRGFTAFAEISEPEEVMRLLRTYREEMGKLILEYEGTLEQMSADAMMVVFNDPVLTEDPAGRAVRMALRMQERAEELMTPWRRQGHRIALGTGIAHGYATIGNVGYDAQVAYGVVGRVTNLATRLSKEAASGEVLISGAVYAMAEDVVHAEAASRVDLSGFARPASAYRLLSLKTRVAQPRVWPLKIFTLGQFALKIRDEPVTFSRKTQRKPLDLLRALIAHGGVRVEAAMLISELWPDSDGDAAKITFDSTLYRLRKLIGVDDCLVLSEGKLSLNASLCWSDTWALDEVAGQAERLAHEDESSVVDANTVTKDLLRLYAGHFLEEESKESWAMAARDKLKAKFVRAVAVLGARLESRAQWEQAIALYARALELDNLAESLYRRLMTAYREQGEPAEALNVYRRCRDILSVVLGIKPSPETEAIRASLG